MAKIISIATGVPPTANDKGQIVDFISNVHSENAEESRKMKFLQRMSGIETRYSIVPDFDLAMKDWQFFPKTKNLEPFPTIDLRMKWFSKYAAPLCVSTIEKAIDGLVAKNEITHLVTVSCTGMSAPGLDLQIAEQLQLNNNIGRTSVNFMGCYAAVHGLKVAEGIIAADENAVVVLVCLEFCSLHFQKQDTADNLMACVLFADGCAAVVLKANQAKEKGLVLDSFYSEIVYKGKQDMAWEISTTGFLMTLTSYVSQLVGEDFAGFAERALAKTKRSRATIGHWCIHPGGKAILESIANSMSITKDELKHSYDILKNYGNMSSATILFVLQQILKEMENSTTSNQPIFGAAFGPGLTMDSFTAYYD